VVVRGRYGRRGAARRGASAGPPMLSQHRRRRAPGPAGLPRVPRVREREAAPAGPRHPGTADPPGRPPRRPPATI